MKATSIHGRSRQRGMSFIGLVLLGALIVSAFAVGAQAVPTYVEYIAVKRAVDRAKQGNTVQEVQALFDKSAAVDDITALTGKDLEITKRNDKVVVAFAYKREIHLVGPAYLVMKYEGQTN